MQAGVAGDAVTTQESHFYDQFARRLALAGGQQTVTQVPQPKTSTFSAVPTRDLISSSIFCSATIMLFAPYMAIDEAKLLDKNVQVIEHFYLLK